ncbi:hypothetical protein ASF73_13755 [Xanthomonas sp. Leaf131]|nr:hypothetical protein ASF73_13755 [Xanthomonas sp. Leaf131]
MAHHLQLSYTTAWFAARDSARVRLQSVGVVFGRCGVVCRAVLVGWAKTTASGLRFLNDRFFRMSRDVKLQPGELVHRSGLRAAKPATWSHTVGLAHDTVRVATSFYMAGMDLPFQPALSPLRDGQP